MKDLSDLEFGELVRLSMYTESEPKEVLEKRLYMMQMILLGDMYQIITDEYGEPYQVEGRAAL